MQLVTWMLQSVEIELTMISQWSIPEDPLWNKKVEIILESPQICIWTSNDDEYLTKDQSLIHKSNKSRNTHQNEDLNTYQLQS